MAGASKSHTSSKRVNLPRQTLKREITTILTVSSAEDGGRPGLPCLPGPNQQSLVGVVVPCKLKWTRRGKRKGIYMTRYKHFYAKQVSELFCFFLIQTTFSLTSALATADHSPYFKASNINWQLMRFLSPVLILHAGRLHVQVGGATSVLLFLDIVRF